MNFHPLEVGQPRRVLIGRPPAPALRGNVARWQWVCPIRVRLFAFREGRQARFCHRPVSRDSGKHPEALCGLREAVYGQTAPEVL